MMNLQKKSEEFGPMYFNNIKYGRLQGRGECIS